MRYLTNENSIPTLHSMYKAVCFFKYLEGSVHGLFLNCSLTLAFVQTDFRVLITSYNVQHT